MPTGRISLGFLSTCTVITMCHSNETHQTQMRDKGPILLTHHNFVIYCVFSFRIYLLWGYHKPICFMLDLSSAFGSKWSYLPWTCPSKWREASHYCKHFTSVVVDDLNVNSCLQYGQTYVSSYRSLLESCYGWVKQNLFLNIYSLPTY